MIRLVYRKKVTNPGGSALVRVTEYGAYFRHEKIWPGSDQKDEEFMVGNITRFYSVTEGWRWQLVSPLNPDGVAEMCHNLAHAKAILENRLYSGLLHECRSHSGMCA